MTPYIDKFEGHRLNSPNDLVYRSDGTLYFTRSTLRPTRGDTDPAKELTFNGVFLCKGGQLKASHQGSQSSQRPRVFARREDPLCRELRRREALWMRYDVAADGTVSNGRMFFDLAEASRRAFPTA